MKKTLSLVLAALAWVNFATVANATSWSETNIDIEDMGPQSIEETPGPFNIDVSGDWIGKAKVRCPGSNDLQFATAQVDANLVYHYDACNKEALSIGVTYMRTRLDWKFNPFFSQRDVDTASLNLGIFSQRLPNWTWRAQFSVNFDNIEHWSFSDYMNYDLLVWGRYAYCPNLGVHVGFLALTGMKIDRVYPILGIDWTINNNWKLSAVFPVDIALTYTINPCWNVALGARFFNQRHRVKENEFYSKALWFYTTGGGEFAINYQPARWIQANIHAGYNLGGHLKIANRHYHCGQRLRLDGAPYAGAEIALNF